MGTPVAMDVVRQIPYFRELGAEELESLRRILKEESFARGDVVQHEGDACQAMYFVRSGRVRIFKTSPEGRIQVLRVMGPGETFNEVPVFDGGPNPASVEALEPTALVVMGREAMRRLVHERPAVALALLGALARKLRHFTHLVEDLSFKTVTGRVIRILLELARPEQAGEPPARMTQEELAAMVGTSREVVGRALKALERQGAIRIQRQRIAILDPARLRAQL